MLKFAIRDITVHTGMTHTAVSYSCSRRDVGVAVSEMCPALVKSRKGGVKSRKGGDAHLSGAARLPGACACCRVAAPVDDVLGVAVLQRGRQRGDVRCRAALVEASLALQFLVQLTLTRELQNEVDARCVVEVAEEAEDVGVPQVTLDLNLAPQLVLHVRLLQLRLEQHLRRGR